MCIFIKHILRNLEDNIGRTLLILFTLFGVGLIVSFCITFIYTEKDFIQLYLKNNIPFDYAITSSEEENLTYDKLLNLGLDVSYIGLDKFDNGYIFKNDNYTAISLTSFNFETAKKFKFLDGYNNFSLNDNEIILNKDIANKLKIKINDEIIYYNSNGDTFSLKVKYLTNNSLSSALDKFIITNENTYMKITDTSNLQYEMFLGLYEGNDDINIENKKINDIEEENKLTFSYIDSNSIINNNINRTLKITTVILIITLVIVYFVLNSIVKIIMNERIPVVGSFRSVGASNKMMNFLLICEMGFYGLIGGLVGSTFSTKFTGSIFKIIYQMENIMGNTTNSSSIDKIQFYMIIFTTLLLVLFQVSLSLNEILNFNKMTIKECMFNNHENRFKRKYLNFFVGIFFLVIGIGSVFSTYRINYLFGVIAIFSIFISIALILPYIGKLVEKIFKRSNNPIVSMAFNTLNENKLQVSTNIIIAVLTSVSIVAISFLNYYVSTNNNKINYVMSDIYVASSNESLSTPNEILALDNVKSIATIYYGNLSYDSIKIANNELNNENSETIKLIYTDDAKNLKTSSNAINTNYDTWNKLQSDEIIVSNYYKNKYGLKTNDLITLNFRTDEKRFSYDITYDLKIVGFANTDNIAYNSIIVSEKLFTDEILEISEEYFINLFDNKNISDSKKDIKKFLTNDDAKIVTKEEYIKEIKDFIKTTRSLIYILIGIIVGIGLIGIINNQTVAFLQRTKEFAILYSTCMSKKQLSNLILKETILAYSVSSLSSIIFAIVINHLFTYTVDALGFYIPLKFNLLWTILLLLIIGIIMLLIYIAIKGKIKKLNIVEELKYE